MALTRRQKAFLSKLCEIHSSTGRPAHYSRVAEELGVNRFSAHDMLRGLEDKGVVAHVRNIVGLALAAPRAHRTFPRILRLSKNASHRVSIPASAV